MKAISIRQPWAYAICRLGKFVENRQWKFAPSYRGPLLIHAAKGCTRVEYEESVFWMSMNNLISFRDVPPLEQLVRGAYVAVVNMVDAGWQHEIAGDTKWANEGMMVLRFSTVKELPTPIPGKGQLGLYEPPPEVVKAVMAAVRNPISG